VARLGNFQFFGTKKLNELKMSDGFPAYVEGLRIV
jgi:hypothetical protein